MSIDDPTVGSVSRRSDRIAGCFVGLAVGDALGAPLEFLSRHQVRKRYPEGLRDMIDSRLWKKGEYTDDTQMALLIAESLLQRKGFLASDLAQRFQSWARKAKDVGIQTRAVVNMAGYVRDPEGCSSQYHAAHPDSSAGNGALMRCAPVALFCLDSLDRLVEVSRASARVTHHDPKAQSSCVILNAWIQAAICRGIRDGRAEAIGLLNKTERPAWHRLAIELQRLGHGREEETASIGRDLPSWRGRGAKSLLNCAAQLRRGSKTAFLQSWRYYGRIPFHDLCRATSGLCCPPSS
jgi:ADP-ribosylglycohydrolase